MKLYCHKKTITYRDYGSHLETVEGLAWSTDGEPSHSVGERRRATVFAKTWFDARDALARLLGVDRYQVRVRRRRMTKGSRP